MSETRSEPRANEIRYELKGHVAYVTFDRPHVLNALDESSNRRCNEIWDQVERDPSVYAVVVTGAGEKAFCTGADMSTSGVTKSGVDYWADLDPNGFAGLSLRETLDVPVIARVNGYALGGGMETVLGADLVIAAEHAKFGLTEPRVGRLPLDGGMVKLPRRVPYTRAMSLLLTGRKATAQEMADMGLVNEVVPMADLDAAVDRWVKQVLACAPTSLRAIKQVINRTGELSPREAHAARLPALMEALVSPNATEGVEAFQQKREPNWSDR